MRSTSDPLRLIREHLALLASLALVSVAALRIFYFSNLDIATALAIIRVVNYPAVLLASLTTVLALALPIAVFSPAGNWIMAGNGRTASHEERWRTALIWSPTTPLFTGGFTPSVLAALILLTGYLIVDARRSAMFRDVKYKRVRAAGKFFLHLIPTVIVLIVLMPLLFRPWVPLESLESKEDVEGLVGYVMGEEAGQLLVIDREKRPSWIHSNDIQTRTICAEEYSWWNQPLFWDQAKPVKCA
ncbi:hypothetical protein [Arthrobacter sp. NPDC089319]|uniref:hypothetical protein n=1 Tax=Arthrobacter sp. NPDC089319 TaxID=3155915 RepID=UPI00343AAD84